MKSDILSPSDLQSLVVGKKVLIDTNVIIYLTDRVQPYEELSRLLFALIEEGKVEGVLSVVSVAEVIYGPLKKGLVEITSKIREYLLNFPNISCQMIDLETLEQIGIDRRINWPKLRTVDALIIASGLKANVDKIVSNDLHFRKAVSKTFLVSFDL
ncbi:MAG: PIN domain nuclease [Deltaproteobacteria bacterium]|nr:MAG: PIN domain nuclease [Deltaproteobacteria bacterium]